VSGPAARSGSLRRNRASCFPGGTDIFPGDDENRETTRIERRDEERKKKRDVEEIHREALQAKDFPTTLIEACGLV
jgi:hypothetical protein